MSVGIVEGAEKFRAFVQNSADPAWLGELRKTGLSLYESLPTPPPPSRERNFPSLDPAKLSFETLEADQRDTSAENGLAVAASLAEALTSTEYGEKIRPHLGALVNAKSERWAALNQALWQGGTFVYAPQNADAGNVTIYHHAPGNHPLTFPRVFIFAESGSKLIVLDRYESDGVIERFAAPVVEIVASDNSEVHYVQIQEQGKQTHHHSSVKIHAGRDARVTAITCTLGARRSVNKLGVSLRGQGAQAQILGMTLGSGAQVFEHYTLQEHLAPQTESDLLVKTALKDEAYSHFDGLIWIEKGAKKTSAYQQNRNLLLSQEAKAETTPRLEILDDDVRCTHGATVGPVDEEQLFYLACRGIGRRDAEALIVEGFLQQVLERIPFQSLKEKLAEEISKRLRG